jgi:hypothetical protein
VHTEFTKAQVCAIASINKDTDSFTDCDSVEMAVKGANLMQSREDMCQLPTGTPTEAPTSSSDSLMCLGDSDWVGDGYCHTGYAGSKFVPSTPVLFPHQLRAWLCLLIILQFVRARNISFGSYNR